MVICFVVVRLSIVILSIVASKYPKPGSICVIDKVFPRITPNPVIGRPIFLIASLGGEQSGRGQAFRLDPKIFVVIIGITFEVIAIDQSAVNLIPSEGDRPV